MKLTVLICDDVFTERQKMIAALVNVPPTHKPEKRVNLAHTFFDIHEYSIVGEAIDNLDEKTNVALIDVNYQNLSDQFVIDKGYDIGIEKSPLRGFALFDAISSDPKYKEIHRCLFTAFSSDFREILDNLKQRGEILQEWYYKDKGDGFEHLSKDIPSILRISAGKIIRKIDVNSEKPMLLSLIKQCNDNELQKKVISISGRNYLVENLLIGWCEEIINDQIVFKISIRELLTESLVTTEEYGTELGGIWSPNKDDEVNKKIQEALYLYKTDQNYLEVRKEIETIAIKCLTYIVKSLDAIKNQTKIISYRELLDFNCLAVCSSNKYTMEKLKERMKTSLILRRVALGISYINNHKDTALDEPKICGLLGLFLDKKIDDLYFLDQSLAEDTENMKYKKIVSKTDTALRQTFNNILGLSTILSIDKDRDNYQSFCLNKEHLLKEEWEWLNSSLSLHIDKFKYK